MAEWDNQNTWIVGIGPSGPVTVTIINHQVQLYIAVKSN